MLPNKNNLIWIDLEMTGLDPTKHYILEIGILITDIYLNILSKGLVITIHQDEVKMKSINKWSLHTHTKNGLLKRVENSLYNEKTAEITILTFLKKWVPKKTSPICGSTVSQDRRFLFKYMPQLEEYFHYRHIDVSTLKELALRWKPEIIIKKNSTNHLPLEDLKRSINELLHYKKYFIRK